MKKKRNQNRGVFEHQKFFEVQNSVEIDSRHTNWVMMNKKNASRWITLPLHCNFTFENWTQTSSMARDLPAGNLNPFENSNQMEDGSMEYKWESYPDSMKYWTEITRYATFNLKNL